MTDPITDMFNRIRNAQLVKDDIVEIPFSILKSKIAEILKNEGFVSDVKKRGRKPHQVMKVQLKYTEKKMPAIFGFRRISKPGQRIYRKAKELKRVRSGFGIAIVSTSKGLMTGRGAKKKKLGGEVMVEIW